MTDVVAAWIMLAKVWGAFIGITMIVVWTLRTIDIGLEARRRRLWLEAERAHGHTKRTAVRVEGRGR